MLMNCLIIWKRDDERIYFDIHFEKNSIFWTKQLDEYKEDGRIEFELYPTWGKRSGFTVLLIT